ncbi:MAG: hypothetical protein J5919_05730 [Clostridia bacterium]|nr:hypothetical protein [Clostridia bacterium]MBP5173788.1 hypothetical protein [Clostridia bacterium]
MKRLMKRAAAALIAVLMICICLASCNGSKTEKPKVTVEIYDDADEIFLKVVDMEIEDTTTAEQAVEMLCTLREAKFTKDIDGNFDSFTFEERTISAKQEKLDNGNVKMFSFAWKLNDEIMTATSEDAVSVKMSDKVLVTGDKVVLYFLIQEVTPDTK